MSEVTVSQLASDVGIPVDRRITASVGVGKKAAVFGATPFFSDADKMDVCPFVTRCSTCMRLPAQIGQWRGRWTPFFVEWGNGTSHRLEGSLGSAY